MFVGRERELKALENAVCSPRFEMPIIYGRRRVGKTELIKEFVKDKNAIFFTAVQSTAKVNLELLTVAINACDSKQKIIGELKDFNDAFSFIAQIAKESSSPLIFVIDEYPYLAKSDSSISSILQMVIDRYYLNIPNLMLLLCGSSMSFMEKQVLGYESPLYGRRTAQFKVEPFTAFEARQYLPNMNNNDFLTIYGLTGGIPMYMSYMDDSLPLKDNLLNNFFKRNCFLIEEPEAFLKQELANPENYFAILKAIAGGASSFNDISMKTGLTASSLTDNLSKLKELGIAEKVLPLGVTKRNAAIYQVTDGLFAFWFKVVPKNLIYIEQDKDDIIWDIVQEDLRQFTSKIFEQLGIQWIKSKIGDGTFNITIKEIGSWWGKNPHIHSSASPQHEIDILAFGQEANDVLLAECKWRNEPVGSDVVNRLLTHGGFFPAGKRDYVIFSKSGFTQDAAKSSKEHGIKLIRYDEMI